MVLNIAEVIHLIIIITLLLIIKLLYTKPANIHPPSPSSWLAMWIFRHSWGRGLDDKYSGTVSNFSLCVCLFGGITLQPCLAWKWLCTPKTTSNPQKFACFCFLGAGTKDMNYHKQLGLSVLFICLFVCWLAETALAVLEITLETRLASNSEICQPLPPESVLG